MLVLSLLGAVQLAQINDEAARLEQQVEALKQENQIRSAAYENTLSLEEIERFAVDKLGLQHCSPGQIVYVSAGEK